MWALGLQGTFFEVATGKEDCEGTDQSDELNGDVAGGGVMIRSALSGDMS